MIILKDKKIISFLGLCLLLLLVFVVVDIPIGSGKVVRAQQAPANELGGWMWGANWISDADGSTTPDDYELGGIGWIDLNSGPQIDPTSNWEITGRAMSQFGEIRFGGLDLTDVPTGFGTTSDNARLANVNLFYNQGTGFFQVNSADFYGWVRACNVYDNEANCSGSLKSNLKRGDWDGWISLSGESLSGQIYGITSSLFGVFGEAWGGGDMIGWIVPSSMTVDVGVPPDQCAITLEAVDANGNPVTSVEPDSSVTLNWSFANITDPGSCTETGNGGGWFSPQDSSATVTMTQITTFGIECTEDFKFCETEVSVGIALTTCSDINAQNFGGPLPCAYSDGICNDLSANNTGQLMPCTYTGIILPPLLILEADPPLVDNPPDNYTTLKWYSPTSDQFSASDCEAFGGWTGSRPSPNASSWAGGGMISGGYNNWEETLVQVQTEATSFALKCTTDIGEEVFATATVNWKGFDPFVDMIGRKTGGAKLRRFNATGFNPIPDFYPGEKFVIDEKINFEDISFFTIQCFQDPDCPFADPPNRPAIDYYAEFGTHGLPNPISFGLGEIGGFYPFSIGPLYYVDIIWETDNVDKCELGFSSPNAPFPNVHRYWNGPDGPDTGGDPDGELSIDSPSEKSGLIFGMPISYSVFGMAVSHDSVFGMACYLSQEESEIALSYIVVDVAEDDAFDKGELDDFINNSNWCSNCPSATELLIPRFKEI